jgi:hypothetical protein
MKTLQRRKEFKSALIDSSRLLVGFELVGEAYTRVRKHLELNVRDDRLLKKFQAVRFVLDVVVEIKDEGVRLVRHQSSLRIDLPTRPDQIQAKVPVCVLWRHNGYNVLALHCGLFTKNVPSKSVLQDAVADLRR